MNVLMVYICVEERYFVLIYLDFMNVYVLLVID